MSLQTIINSAQSIEVQRQSLTTTSISRSGRLLTAARNWVKPWQFIVVPKPVMRIAEARPVIESLMNYDRHTDQIIQLGATSGSTWLVEYQGDLSDSDVSTGLTVNSASTGTNLRLDLNSTIQALPQGTVIFEPGDIIQPLGHRYPYVVQNQVTRGTTTFINVTLNRGLLPTSGLAFPSGFNGATILVGTDCSWTVKVSKLPTYRFISAQLVEFTGDFEIIESVI